MIPDYCCVCVCPQVLVVGGGDGGGSERGGQTQLCAGDTPL